MSFLAALWSRLPLIGRLLVITGMALVIAATALLLLSAHQDAQEIREDLAAELSKELEILPATLAETVVIGDFATLQQTLDYFVGRPLVAAVVFKDVRGSQLLSEKKQLDGHAPTWFLKLFELSNITGSAPIAVGGHHYGTITLTLTAQGLASRAWHRLESHLVILLLTLALDFVGIWLVLRSGLAPLRSLSETMARGDLEVRLESKGSPELRSLIGSFNQMAESVSHAQADLRLSEERLQLATTGVNDGIWDWNLTNNKIYYSAKCLEMLGFTADEIQVDYNTFNLRVHLDDKDATEQALRRYLSGQDPAYSVEYRLRHKDGSWRWILSRGEASRNEAGQAYRMTGAMTDITLRKEQEAALLNERRRLQDVIEGTHVGTWEWNVQTGETIFNERWAEIVGYSLVELMPTTIGTWERLAHPDDMARSNQALQRHFAGESRHYECEARMRHKDGHWVWVLDRGYVASRSADGKPLLMSGTHQDITQRKQYEAELQQAKEAAEAANRAKSAFLATMSHEIRTPMNGILGMAQLLLMPELEPAEREEYVHILINSGQTLLTLLNDILDFSKIEAGKLDLSLEPTSPQQLIEEVAALFAEPAQAKALTLSAHWQGKPQQLYLADPTRLRQMLSNLVSNAIKFTLKGFVRIEARLVEDDGDSALLEFAVEDSGIGISPQQQALLFKPFSQADSSTTRDYGGTGLGLSIVRSLAQLMGGKVGIHSEVGGGSSFFFRIRCQTCISQTPAVSSPRPALNNDDMPQGHVLLVEDVATNRILIETLLRKWGLQISSAVNGAEAVEQVRQGLGADLILMDCQMPVMDGYQATAEIRQWEAQQQCAPTPIIALTADAFAEDRSHCLACGMNDFLAKPLNVTALEQLLRKWMAATSTQA